MAEGTRKKLRVLPEPALEFRYNQKAIDPHDGLALYGPYDADLPSHPRNISYWLIGTTTGIGMFQDFAGVIAGPVISEREPRKLRLWPPYPGFDVAFDCRWPDGPTRTFELDADALDVACRDADPNKRAYNVVEHYLEPISAIANAELVPDIVICAVPDTVYQNCRPQSPTPKDAVGTRPSYSERVLRAGYVRNILALNEDTSPYRYSVDFRRQLKARAMTFEVPIQILRESVLRPTDGSTTPGQRTLTPLSDRAWNISLALFYKGGGRPWRLSTARDGVCYVGIVFRRADPYMMKDTACCAAQMFLDDGDGIVLRGDFGPWYSAESREFHLTRKAAKDLLSKVLTTYRETFGKPLKEVFLHYRISINDEEFSGFSAACPDDVKLVAVRIQNDPGTRLYREGTRPVRRGSLWCTSESYCYLWASGFKPRLGTYDGSETPVPLSIDLERGKGDIVQVATDILGLTKLNFNECKYGDSRPVTIGFSESVGEILVSNPTIKNPNPRFAHYI